MRKFFDKHDMLVTIALIILYILSNSICLNNFGVTDYRTAIVNTIFSIILLLLVVILKKTKYYGLTKPNKAKCFLYFIPLVLIVSVNLWTGININNTYSEITFHIITMLNVGIIEELIFRGFLFKMMEKDNRKLAVIVSSVTFGIGHIINLFNGADVIPTLLQICYATSIGFLFVIIFYKSKSLIPCILAHAVNNSLSIFVEENSITLYIAPIFLIIVPIIYSIYIIKKYKKKTMAT